MTDRFSTPFGIGPSRINQCWNSIGVRGDSSCPELRQHIHCRNCPVYSRAALELLDNAPPRDYVAVWTAHVAKPKPVDDHDRHPVFIFRVNGEWLALPTHVVKEVADARPIHPLPHRNTGVVLGLANVRGELLVCVSLARVLGLDQWVEPSPAAPRTVYKRLLVIGRETVHGACPVDEVHGLSHLHASDLKEVPTTVAKAAATYSKAVASWRGKAVGLLDDQRLFAALQRSLA